MRTDTILALDPGLRDLGFAILTRGRFRHGGVIPLRLLPTDKRIPEAKRQLRSWFRLYRPDTVVIEQTHWHPVPWLDGLDVLAKVIALMAKRRGINVATYAAQTVRKHLLGNGRATKREAAHVVATWFPSLRVYLTQDRKWKERYWQNMFDAVALAIHHRRNGQPPS